ncbi:MAG: patatin-like phospholipase family protein [Sulfurisoma sp.]|nr:patatin-like phospholipase family protein [Sulfurisoma sp.]
MTSRQPRTALILGGGGARAAYQVGVLKAVRELVPDPARNPFPILCGTSAGSLNAAVLAVRARDFAAGVDTLEDLWSNIHAGDVYRADALSMVAAGARWLLRRNSRSLLDNAPLRRLLERAVDFEQLEPAVAGHALLALSVTCSGYASGQSVSFFQGRADLEPWNSGQRVGAHVILGIDHLMASNAIPFLFPAVRMNREYFGDGAMRQLSPMSPAIRLGAEKLMVIGEGRMSDEGEEREPGEDTPSLARIAGHALSGIYVDPLSADLERARHINQTLQLIPAETRASATTPRQLDVLALSPSRRLDHLAADHVGALPLPVRALIEGIGATRREGGALASYLLFEPPYTRALIELGHRDTLARGDEIRRFLDIT